MIYPVPPINHLNLIIYPVGGIFSLGAPENIFLFYLTVNVNGLFCHCSLRLLWALDDYDIIVVCFLQLTPTTVALR